MLVQGIYSYSSRLTHEGRLAIVTSRGAGCGGRGSVGPKAECQGAGPERGAFLVQRVRADSGEA